MHHNRSIPRPVAGRPTEHRMQLQHEPRCTVNCITRLSISILSFHLRLGLTRGLLIPFSDKNSTCTCTSPTRVSWPFHVTVLDFITIITFGEDHNAPRYALLSRSQTHATIIRGVTLCSLVLKLSTVRRKLLAPSSGH